MIDPCYKQFNCVGCGNVTKIATGWAADERCIKCGKWVIRTEANKYEEELKNLKREYDFKKERLASKYFSNKPFLKIK